MSEDLFGALRLITRGFARRMVLAVARSIEKDRDDRRKWRKPQNDERRSQTDDRRVRIAPKARSNP